MYGNIKKPETVFCFRSLKSGDKSKRYFYLVFQVVVDECRYNFLVNTLISIFYSFKLFRSLSDNLIFNTAFFLIAFLADFVALVISSFLASETLVYVFFCLLCCWYFWYSDILRANNKVIFRCPKQNCTSFLFRVYT